MGITCIFKPFEVFDVDRHCYLLSLTDSRACEITADDAEVLRGEQNAAFYTLLSGYGLLLAPGEEDPKRMQESRWKAIRQTYRQIYALELMVSQECNMECTYCYGSGNFGGTGLMSPEMARRSVDWLVDAGAAKDVLISFFGGEPLLNFPVIRETVAYCHQLFKPEDIQFLVTTNLSLINEEMLDFFERYHVDLCVSFDGKSQRENRRYKDGRDSYADILEKITKVLAKRPDTLGRGTLYGNYSRQEIYQDLWQAGFTRTQVMAASGHLLNNRRLFGQAKMYREQLYLYPQLTKRYIQSVKTRDQAAVKEILLDSDFRELVAFGWRPKYNQMYCGCGRNLFTVDVKGSVYPCHRFVGLEAMRLGTIEKPFDQLKKEVFEDHVTFKNPSCKACFLRFVCGGSCMQEAYCDAGQDSEEKSVFRPFEEFCTNRRQAAKLGIHVKYRLDNDDKKWVSQWKNMI